LSFAAVIVNMPARAVDKPFTYGVPDALAERVRVGTMVTVPFGRQKLSGYVVGLAPQPPPDVPPDKIRDILEAGGTDEVWGRDLLAIAQWMHTFYGALIVESLHTIVPEPVRASFTTRDKPKRRGVAGRVRVVTLADGDNDPETFLAGLDGEAPQARRILDVLRRAGALPPGELLSEAQAHREVLGHLKTAGLVRYRQVAAATLEPADDPLRDGAAPALLGTVATQLTPAQDAAVNKIRELMAAGKPAVVLLHGITGSGKTEVYLRSLQHVVEAGCQGLVLVPEISLTPQAVDRYRSRLGEQVAIMHSALTPHERVQEWWSLKQGRMSVALGARSCVFAPLERPALYIVDEEHDSSYKQEQSPRYHARQVAIRRAMETKSVVLLGSATPSMESYYWALQGKYHLIELPGRVADRPLPEVEIVDLRRRKKVAGGLSLSPLLKSRMRETLERGEQVMLLMNRRGFSSYLMCEDCGEIVRCPRCDISLTYHSSPPAMLCHYCLYEKPPASICHKCGGFALGYFGSGTQRVEDELRTDFDGYSVLRMDRDTTRKMGDHRRLLERFGKGEAQILLGTQMIAKGHDFPGVTLVGVVLADMALNLPDFRSAERTFSLLVQVAGRAGRGEQPGRVVIQTFNPEHPAVQFAARQDYAAFYADEIALRQELWYPPFSHLVNVLFFGEDERAVRAAAEHAAATMASTPEARAGQMLGPAPCALARIHRKHRWHLTFKAHQVQEIMPVIRNYLAHHAVPGVQVAVDADPMSML
jgi:primosomal protein N' (replication factor Y)